MTSKKTIIGKCRICGKEDKLTFEHIPPRASYNKEAVKTVNLLDVIEAEKKNIMPWDLDRMPSTISQRGRGAYCLCERCNNITGAWYGFYYKQFADALMCACAKAKKENAQSVMVKIKGMRPLPIIKQVITMFCDINTSLTDTNPDLRDYLLNKESKDLDTSKYRVFMFLVSGGLQITAGRTVLLRDGLQTPIVLSEIATVPVGFIIYENMPKDFDPLLTEITDYTNCNYSDSAELTLALNVFEINSIFPNDFRSKEEIRTNIEKSKT